MPELPEVEVVRLGLEPIVTGATVESVTVFEERSLRRHPGPAEDFIERLTGRVLQGAVRRGKFLWLPLDGNTEALVVHLGMSGQVLLRASGQPDDSLLRISVGLGHPAHGDLRMDFVDQRIFGSMALDNLVATADGHLGGLGGLTPTVPTKVAHIARDPLDPAFDDSAFYAALARRKTGIKRALLDQGMVSGIGNIYADEALWAARIHYDQPTGTLSRARAKTLLAEVRHVLLRALEQGGTSFDQQYVNVNGASGYFSRSLSAYGKQGTPCPRCGRDIVRESFMNRNSHYCRICQRLR